MARYAKFTLSLLRLIVPADTGMFWGRGAGIAENLNDGVTKSKGDWIWLMGDDHEFEPQTLVRLLDRDVDIVAPVCSRRRYPFQPVAYNETPEGLFANLPWKGLSPNGDLMEVDAAGTAGMLIKKHVFEKMSPPWFEIGQIETDKLSEDLVFCRKARKEGFKILLDTNNVIGHMAPHTVWPRRRPDGTWTVDIDLEEARIDLRDLDA